MQLLFYPLGFDKWCVRVIGDVTKAGSRRRVKTIKVIRSGD